jgi:hypothetical protein
MLKFKTEIDKCNSSNNNNSKVSHKEIIRKIKDIIVMNLAMTVVLHLTTQIKVIFQYICKIKRKTIKTKNKVLLKRVNNSKRKEVIHLEKIPTLHRNSHHLYQMKRIIKAVAVYLIDLISFKILSKTILSSEIYQVLMLFLLKL